MKISAVIFDWAGTMVDFGSIAPVIAMRQAFAREGVQLTDADIRPGMGLAKRDHVSSILSSVPGARAWAEAHGRDADSADIDRIFEALGPLMAEAGADRATLIPGAAHCARFLGERGVRIGSTTGYTQEMMEPIRTRARAQGYAPELVVCAGDTLAGRPAPFMIWRALEHLGCWPASSAIKVDDAPVGIEEGRNAGCITIGVAVSGNAMGLDAEAFQALTPEVRSERTARAAEALYAAGADFVIESVEGLPSLLQAEGLI